MDERSAMSVEQQKAYVRAWRARSEVYAEIRREQASYGDTERDLEALAWFFRESLNTERPTSCSGLTEFHRRLGSARGGSGGTA